MGHSVTGTLVKAGLLAAGAACLTTKILRARRHYDLRGKVVLITGGSRGLGLAMAREFGKRGARVAIVARHEEELIDAAARLFREGVYVMPWVGNVSDFENMEHIINEVQTAMGPIGVLVNNAAILAVGPEREMTHRDYEQAMRIIFEAPLRLMERVVPEMKLRRGGRVVNIASFGGKVPVPHMAPYAAAKHALVGLSETLRTELVDHNVFVTTVCPGMINDGAEMNVEFRGRTKEEFAWFAAGAESMAAVSVEELARRIVDACVNGDGAVIYPFSTRLMATGHALMPNLSLEVLTLGERKGLPKDDRSDVPARGRALAGAAGGLGT